MKLFRVGPIHFFVFIPVFILGVGAMSAAALDAPQTLHHSKSRYLSHFSSTHRATTGRSASYSSGYHATSIQNISIAHLFRSYRRLPGWIPVHISICWPYHGHAKHDFGGNAAQRFVSSSPSLLRALHGQFIYSRRERRGRRHCRRGSCCSPGCDRCPGRYEWHRSGDQSR